VIVGFGLIAFMLSAASRQRLSSAATPASAEGEYQGGVMKPWVWIVAAFALVLLILFAIPQTRCTLTGGHWLPDFGCAGGW
jgi:hypothetical protein